MLLTDSEEGIIRAWSGAAGLLVNTEMLRKAGIFKGLILSWSKRINLLSDKDLDLIIKNHFLDSLVPLNEISHEGRFIDIGSGSGFPGIPLALLRPAASFTLTESVHKKILFLREAQRALSLDNIEIFEGRFENLGLPRSFDMATVRALSRIKTLMPKIHEIVKPGGKIIYYEKRGLYRLIPVTA
jgi:16S rRNA (guanine527-N7)-methyltransferase